MTPSTFKPQAVEDFIGDAGTYAKLLTQKIAKVRDEPNARLKIIFYGSPGTAKSELAMFLARLLVSHNISIQKLNGQSFSVDWVRECYRNRQYRPFDNGWSVQIVNEIDHASPEALAQALEYWDDLPPHFAFIATSNAPLATNEMSKDELRKAIPLRGPQPVHPIQVRPGQA
jgi:DNA polymerase III delta prime subunit